MRRFRPDVQGLRAIAVLLVVLYHAKVPGVTGGYVGVDVFFVISGFLITGQLVREAARTGRVSLPLFYARRARRLMLPAAVVVVATLCVGRALSSVYEFKALSLDAVFTALYSLNYRLAAQGVDYQAANGPLSPLQHFWSLAVEEQFYALWPLLIIAAVLLGRRRWVGLLAGILAAVTAGSLLLSSALTETNAPYAYFSLHTRAWELGVGGLLALGATRLSRVPRAVAAAGSWAGVAAIVVAGIAFDDATPFPGTAALLPVLGTALVVAAGCRGVPTGAEPLLATRPMQGVGKVSYAWYLWHWPPVVLIPAITGVRLAWPALLGLMVVALGLAAATYVAIERPALASRLRKRAWLGTAAGVAAGTVAFALLLRISLPSLVGTGAAVAPIPLKRADTTEIQQALDRSLAMRRAPSNLAPALDDIRDDEPSSNNNGCHVDLLDVAQPSCVYGDRKGRHSAVLFGDSHAQQWEPALDAMGKRIHWRVMSWTKSSCPAADVTLNEEHIKRIYTECTTWRQQTLARIVKARPDLVVLSQSDDVPGQQLTDQQWADATLVTVKRLKAAGIRVTYLMDTPVPGTDAPLCVADHLSEVTACARPRADAYTDADRHKTMRAALEAAGVRIVEPVNWFCTGDWCPSVVGGMLVYRDRSHMSTVYSRWLTPMLRPVFVARH
jgi:peptidoglycan/LPS O-acetylase OafA/YrhL